MIGAERLILIGCLLQDSPPKPKLTTEKVEVMEGTSVSLSCSAAAPCPKLPPNLTWTPRLSDSVDQLQENEDNTTSVSSVLTFTASHLHHEQKITCRALYTLQQGGNQMSEASLTLKVQYMPQISGSGSCSRTAAEISCSCESRGNPSPSMEWRVSGLRVTNSTDRVIREEQLGNTGLRSSLTMRHSQGDTATLLCLSTNALGTSSLQLCVPSPQQHSACSKMATQDEESTNANKTTLSDPGAVGKGNGTSLHYATVDFSKLRSTGGNQGTGVIRGTSQRTSDYAVIRHRSREEGEEVQGEVEVEKEGPAELGAERETAEQPSVNPDPVEEATYGNICRSRPTKRAQQGQQETPRNPAPEEEEQREEGQEDIYVDLMSPLTEGGGKGVEESEYAEVRKLQ
ncbi:hypothetical protein COCON_G00002280 [Conger conger]|uniref:Ig-like domain-containing protein n=1 Tax=Conger conger TaxID=82655 RepID=A0A9Q1E0X3_CONCO|nr:hypothetical protein COCON_G00002280 [Conger conger]